MKIEGSVIWVTGGCSGMGLASVKSFLSKGAKVLITDINAEAGNMLEKELGENVIFIKANITEPSELDAAVKVAVAKWGKLNALLTCAGGSTGQSWALPMMPTAESMSDGGERLDWQYADSELNLLESHEVFLNDLKLNLIGSYDAARIAAYEMKKNEPDENGERGSIIFITSNAASKRNGPGFSCGYSAGKAGLIGLAKEMAVNLGAAGIRVNNILPAYIETPMTLNSNSGPVGGDLLKHRLDSQLFPNDRGGKPENIASVAVELIENWFINNAVIEVTGGAAGPGGFQRKSK